MNEAREYYNSKKQEIFDQYFRSKTKKGDEIDENIFKNRKQNYNDSENHTTLRCKKKTSGNYISCSYKY